MCDNNDRIARLLDTLDVKYEREKQFSGLYGVFGGPLSFDFYIPSISLLLEYQGPQHYATRFGLHGGNSESSTRVHELKMLSQQEHDTRKRRFCVEQALILVEIPPGLQLDTERSFLADCVSYWTSYRERLEMSSNDTQQHQQHDEYVQRIEHPVLESSSRQSKMLASLRSECMSVTLELQHLQDSITVLTNRVKTKKEREQVLMRALRDVDKELRIVMTPANEAVQQLHTKLDKLAIVMEDCATVCFQMHRRARKKVGKA